MRRANSVNLSVTCTCHMEKAPHQKSQCDENRGLSRVRALQKENLNFADQSQEVACASCHCKFSPVWWDPPPNHEHAQGDKLCQKCYWKAKSALPQQPQKAATTPVEEQTV